MAVRIDGKAVAAKVRGEIAEEIAALKKQGVQTGMAVVLVGEDPASKIYVRNKGKACAETGIYSEEHVLPENTTQEELLALIEKLNADPKINGILVQSPLPKHLNEALIVEHIDPKKDVDAFHAENVGHIMIGDFAFLPCTPAGIIELIRSTGVTIDGKNCVVIGRSNIVGGPMGLMLLNADATVTYCHRRTQDLASFTRLAGILIVAAGSPRLIRGDMVKDGAVVIDVAMNRDPETGKFFGDVCFDEVEPKAAFITPVPGGVGPMTRARLMKNILAAAKCRAEK